MDNIRKRTRTCSVLLESQPSIFTLDLEEVDAAILEHLESLLLKIESRLRSIETPAAAFKVDNTLSRLRESFNSIEMPSIKDKVQATIGIIGESYSQAAHAKMCLSERLRKSIEILEHKYVELEHSSFGKMDDALDLLEKVDRRAILDYTLDRLDCHRMAAIAGAKRQLRFEELPEQWQHNMYILSGYRFLSTNYECFRSIFYIHNESGNIWTHLVGFFYFLVVGIYFFFSGSNPYLSRPPSEDALFAFAPADGYDKLVFLIYFMAVYKCLLMSSLWHTFAHIAHEKTMRCMACLDYVGISVLIAASGVVTEFYGFYCDSFFRNTYIMTTGAFGIAGVVVPWLPWFDRKGMVSLRNCDHKQCPCRAFSILNISLSHSAGGFYLHHVLCRDSYDAHYVLCLYGSIDAAPHFPPVCGPRCIRHAPMAVPPDEGDELLRRRRDLLRQPVPREGLPGDV